MNRYQKWLAHIQLWADLYGITTDQAINILFMDSIIENEDINKQSCYWAEHGDFLETYLRGKK